MQSNLAPSVTPRPVRANANANANANASASAIAHARGGRTYSPVKPSPLALGSKSPEVSRPA
ncbi:hypothetical protein PINS_up011078 [Pythium insidiosum]|nr:hypothetical protein PINS_up011078 [Pythium insidiosum]